MLRYGRVFQIVKGGHKEEYEIKSYFALLFKKKHQNVALTIGTISFTLFVLIIRRKCGCTLVYPRMH